MHCLKRLLLHALQHRKNVSVDFPGKKNYGKSKTNESGNLQGTHEILKYDMGMGN